MKQQKMNKTLHLLMLAGIGTADRKYSFQIDPSEKSYKNDPVIRTHQAIKYSKHFPHDWQNDLLIVKPVKNKHKNKFKKIFMLIFELLRTSLLTFWISRKYDVLICDQITVYSINLALFQQVLFWNRPILIIREFIIGDASRGKITFLKKIFIKLIFRKVNLFVCGSRDETFNICRLFGWAASRVVFLPLASLYIYLKSKSVCENEFILSAGRSGRDYSTLFYALNGLNLNVLLVCSQKNLINLKIPPNIKVKYDIPRKEYESLVERCAFIVIPLHDSKCSVGQRVILTAMSCGKAVIVTRTSGTQDYIIHGKTGIFVEPGDYNKMREAILMLWNNKQLRNSIGAQGRDYAFKYFSYDMYAKDFIYYLKKIVKSSVYQHIL